MTAPMSLREYFAAAGSPFSIQQAAVIGPQLEAMAEDGILDTKNEETASATIVDVARSENHPLHDQFIWDDARAAHVQRLGHAKTMLRSIRVRFVQDERPRTSPAYKITRAQPKSAFARGHNVLRGTSAAAVEKARQALDELKGWRARFEPYVVVWKDFAGTFRGVTNQISEAEDVIRGGALADRTDQALMELLPILEACAIWQAKHGGTAQTWDTLAEQAGFLIAAIEEAVAAFSRGGARKRECLRCRTPFESSGPANRLCNRC